ncbi:hypothetical protein G5V58_18795 [Nocardioides anomalus]|uniref:YncE family protein n=1 Tax=Nocardioides anomalus TaxID=2712223 RepID=A0A6G6WGV3_9ACTN|nr:hypothetical protein [Nocardioides anomalus]QIG44558.1 hypothetical protein G5V58_18795 [Nocardioides anomalus]
MTRGRGRAAVSITLALLASALALGAAAPAQAAPVVTPIAIPGAQATNGVAVAADGSAWVAVERYDGSTGQPTPSTLARIAPSGEVTQTAALGGLPANVAVVGNRIWATVPSLMKIAVVDPANPANPTFLSVPAGHCGPVGVVDGGNGKAYLSLPQTDGCASASEIAVVNYGNGSNALTYRSGKGTAFDLVVGAGSLIVPDHDGDVVRRLTLDAADSLPVTATWTAPAGSSGPTGIGIAPDGAVLVTYDGGGGVGRVAPAAASGPLGSFATGLSDPYGVASVGSDVYVASSALNGGTSSVLVVHPDGTRESLTLPAGTKAWDVAAAGTTAYVTDRANGRLLRLAPPPAAGSPARGRQGQGRGVRQGRRHALAHDHRQGPGRRGDDQGLLPREGVPPGDEVADLEGQEARQAQGRQEARRRLAAARHQDHRHGHRPGPRRHGHHGQDPCRQEAEGDHELPGSGRPAALGLLTAPPTRPRRRPGARGPRAPHP